MSDKKKGNKLERQAIADLKELGYICHQTQNSPAVMRGGQFISSGNNDIFGVFDVIAVRPADVRFIQVTTTTNMGARQRKVETIADKFPANTAVEVWAWVAGHKKVDQRYKGTQKVYIRRQFFRVVRWIGGKWVDITSDNVGWVDGPAPAVKLAE